MFIDCSSLKSINLSGFKTSEVKRMDHMFQGCSSLSTLYIGHNDFDNANELFEKDNLFNGIGTSDRPCRLVVDSNFDKYVLADHIYTTSGEDNKPIYNWLGGYFTLDNSSADARP